MFVDWVRAAAIAAGVQVAAIGAEDWSNGPFLDDLMGDDERLKTIEVDGR